jgi:large subunit ribosomal protein L9
VKISLNVARSVEEAELQASGKSIQELAAEAEAAAEFEIAELFDELGAASFDEDEMGGDQRSGRPASDDT